MRRSLLRSFLLSIVLLASVAAGEASAALDRVAWSQTVSGVSRVFVADHDGANALEVAIGGGPKLSPDGQRIVYTRSKSIYTLSLRDRQERLVYSSTCSGGPNWGPDAKTIFFSRNCDSRTYSDIWRVGVDGTGARSLVTWKNQQTVYDVSADGTSILFESNAKPNGTVIPYVVYTASAADGSGARQVTPTTGQPYSDALRPHFSPDSTQVAFSGHVDGWADVFKIPTAGGTVQRVTSTGDRNEYVSDWSPRGSSICVAGRANSYPNELYFAAALNATSGAQETVYATGGSGNEPSGCFYRKSSTVFSDHDFLAAEYQPNLYFDTSEQWRPLNVDRFFAERDTAGRAVHRVCDASSCSDATSAASLRLFPSEGAWLDVSGDRSDETSYRTTDTTCVPRELRDCDRGPATASYYRVADAVSPGGYRYIDYWFFYRFNYFWKVNGWFNHEGDWEGVTIAPSKTMKTFDFAAFSAHNGWFSYLRENLSCDGGEPGSCGTESAKAGRRVSVYPANGSHANYPNKCSEVVYGDCQQNNMLAERGHDGARTWLSNDADPQVSLLQLPATGAWPGGNFTDWPGTWGVPTSGDASDGPDSPANQAHWNTPWRSDCGAYNDGCVHEASVTARSALAGTRRPRSVAETSRYCAAWFGPGTTAVACDPLQLSHSLQRRKLSGHSGFELLSPGQAGEAASAPGVAQLSGDALRVGEQVSLTGSFSSRMSLLVRGRDGSELVEARFSGLRLGQGQKASVALERVDGKLKLTLTTATGITVRHIERRIKSFRRPVPPTATASVRAAGGRTELRVSTGSPRVFVHLRSGRGGRTRTVISARTRSGTATLVLPKRTPATTAAVYAMSANGNPSRPRIVRLGGDTPRTP